MNEYIKIDRYFKKERRSLAEILDITPSYYKNAELTSDIFSIILHHKLSYSVKCDTVYDVLHLSPCKILSIPNLGAVSLKKITEWIIDYCKNDKNKISSFTNSDDTKINRLYIILNSMLNKEPLPPFNISEEEKKYIERFNEAIKVIPHKLLFNAMNGSADVADLRMFLFRLFDKEKYIQELNAFAADMKEYISTKRIYSFAKLYCDKFSNKVNDKCSFLLSLPKKTIINELPDKLTDKEISDFKISYSIYCFFKWLTTIDIKNIAEKIFDNKVIPERQYSILKKRSNGETLEKICPQENCSRERVRYLEAQAMRNIRQNNIVSPYYFVRLIYAVNNRHNLANADFEPFLNKEQAQILWYMISKGGLDCKIFYYSKDDNILFFDKNKS